MTNAATIETKKSKSFNKRILSRERSQDIKLSTNRTKIILQWTN